MVSILKQPHGASKGILIFTHKEKALIDPHVPGMAALMKALKEKYVLGMHFGWTAPGFKDSHFMDFFLAAPGCLTLPPDNKKPHIKLASRNFGPSGFRPRPHQPKEWDIICVAHTARFKCLDEFLPVMKQVLDMRPYTRILLIANEPEKPDKQHYYTDMMADYKKLFTPAQQENFDVMLLKRKDGLYAIKQQTMPFFYCASRVFTLFTNEEGNARVIGEAQLCGLPVVCKSWLKGAGRENLNEINSRQFDSLDTAARTFCDLLDNMPDLDKETEELAKEIREDYSLPKLEAALREIFAAQKVPYEGPVDFSNLIHRLPSHVLTLPAHLRTAYTDDLRSGTAAMEYLSDLAGKNPSYPPGLYAFDMLRGLKSFVRGVYYKFKYSGSHQ